jgi:SAM-dependent methyltransferase
MAGPDESYLEINRRNWESRVPLHEAGYGIERFREDPEHLSDVVRFDLPRLGSVAGLDAIHLQCHIGTDTLSLARLGARMTGLDFSPSALEVAWRLAADDHRTIDYVEADVHLAVEVLGAERFDLVYTGIGALCWLPDVRRWASVVAALLRPGGRLFLREGHPMLWSLCDPRDDELLVVEYPYFERPGGTVFVETTTYVEHEGEVASPTSVGFNHGLAEIVNALWAAGLRLDAFEEHRSVPYNPFGPAMVALPNGEYELREDPDRLAASYTIQASRPDQGT